MWSHKSNDVITSFFRSNVVCRRRRCRRRTRTRSGGLTITNFWTFRKKRWTHRSLRTTMTSKIFLGWGSIKIKFWLAIVISPPLRGGFLTYPLVFGEKYLSVFTGRVPKSWVFRLLGRGAKAGLYMINLSEIS